LSEAIGKLRILELLKEGAVQGEEPELVMTCTYEMEGREHSGEEKK